MPICNSRFIHSFLSYNSWGKIQYLYIFLSLFHTVYIYVSANLRPLADLQVCRITNRIKGQPIMQCIQYLLPLVSWVTRVSHVKEWITQTSSYIRVALWYPYCQCVSEMLGTADNSVRFLFWNCYIFLPLLQSFWTIALFHDIMWYQIKNTGLQ